MALGRKKKYLTEVRGPTLLLLHKAAAMRLSTASSPYKTSDIKMRQPVIYRLLAVMQAPKLKDVHPFAYRFELHQS